MLDTRNVVTADKLGDNERVISQRPSRTRIAALAALALASTLAVAPRFSAQAATVPTERIVGDLPMGDGVTLRYTVVKPKGNKKLPTLFEYSGYDPGTNPDAGYISRYVSNGDGYNYIGVSIRGTGCSTGHFDFFEPKQFTDAKKVIAWIISQPWSDRKVGMVGKSYPGITQLFVAEQQPPGLVAIAPGHFFSNAYRDIARPGGIMNYGFASLWSFIARPSYEVQSGTESFLGGDAKCINGTTGELRSIDKNPFVQLQQHQYDDDLIKERSVEPHLDKIKVPILATESWQDEQLGSRGTDLLAQIDDLNAVRRAKGQAETPWWMTVTNGDHGMARTKTEYADLHQFFDYFLKGKKNGWDKRAKVNVWWDAKTSDRAPTWMTGLDHWSEKQRIANKTLTPTVLNLRGDGSLTTKKASAQEPPRSYLYAPGIGSQGIGNPAYGGVSAAPGIPPSVYLWDEKPPAGTSLAWTSSALTTDMTLLGGASLDLWLSATAPDTDLQVTLSEVRPDGQEMYLQKGWLKVSQRKLDPKRSTALRPYQTHTQQDVQMLTPGKAVAARVEIFPFGALLRKGSKLRVSIEAPTVLPELWAFAPFPVAGQNTVLLDAAHPGQLVLPVIPNDAKRATAFPACGSLIRQPCRDS